MRRLLAFACFLLLGLAQPAAAEERILGFFSNATVESDATLEVQETLIVQAEGNAIRHGIYRDFPTIYTNSIGHRVVAGFDVLSVTRDGRPEPYVLQGLSNGTRVKIGDKDVYVTAGAHRYVITYRTTRQIGFYQDFDQLYWNVTGNGWELPIDKAQVTIRLPAGAEISDYALFTGSYGSTSGAAQVITAKGALFEAETTARLSPGEGFTVAVNWQKGVVAPPSALQKLMWRLHDDSGQLALVIGFLVVAGYFLFAWDRVGRDPPQGTIIPLFRPPPGMGAADLRYVSHYGFDNKVFSAALVGLAVKGRLAISDNGARDYSITKRSAPAGAEALTSAEQALYDAIPAGSTALKKTNHETIQKMIRALNTALGRAHDGRSFLKNSGWFSGGLILSLAALLLAVWLMPGLDGANIVVSGLGFGLSLLAASVVMWATGQFSSGLGSTLKGLLFNPRILLGVLMALTAFGGPALLFLQGGADITLYEIAFAAMLLGVTNALFYVLLRAPTAAGRKLMDQIEGFRLYLSTAEEERLNLLHPPEKTPELFERYLPYALALDCANEWNAKFAAVLAAAAAAGATAPIWYTGSNWNDGDLGSFTDSLGSSLASSAAAAATAPGSSSGTGGGGFSGGGGGGGGGGGW